MSICITKESSRQGDESKKDRSNYSVVTNEQRIGSNSSDFIEITTKEPSRGTDQGENNHLCPPCPTLNMNFTAWVLVTSLENIAVVGAVGRFSFSNSESVVLDKIEVR